MRMQMSTTSARHSVQLLRGRDFVTQKINSIILPADFFLQKQPFTVFFIWLFVIIFLRLLYLRPLALLLFKSTIAVSFYLIIAVRTYTVDTHTLGRGVCPGVQKKKNYSVCYNGIKKKKKLNKIKGDLTCNGRVRSVETYTRGVIERLRIVWIKLWR